jgi:tetratricopeptide (TPR) repeat protein
LDGQAPETDRLLATANALCAERRYAEAADAYLGLVGMHETTGRFAAAEAMLLQAQEAAPELPAVWLRTARFLSRHDRFDEAVAAFARLTRLDPADPQPFYQLAVSCEEKVRQDASLRSAQRTGYVTMALEAVDQALALRPDFLEALVYKTLLLRHGARFTADPLAQRARLDDADRVHRQAIDVRNRQARRPRRP